MVKASQWTQYHEYHFSTKNILLFDSLAVQIWLIRENTFKRNKLIKNSKQIEKYIKFEHRVPRSVCGEQEKFGGQEDEKNLFAKCSTKTLGKQRTLPRAKRGLCRVSLTDTQQMFNRRRCKPNSCRMWLSHELFCRVFGVYRVSFVCLPSVLCLALGKQSFLPSVHSGALGKGALCRVPDRMPSAKTQALGKYQVSGSVSLCLAEPPAASCMCLQLPDGIDVRYAWVAAAHGDSVLVQVTLEGHMPDDFVYSMGAAAADLPQSPSLDIVSGT